MNSNPELAAFDAPLRIGVVTLAVRDVDAMATYYREFVGLEAEKPAATNRIVLRSGGSDVLALEHKPAAPFDRLAEPGLYHTAFVVPSRRDLAKWLARAVARGLRPTGAADHKVSEALYFADPEGNGIEVYADRPRAAWQRTGMHYVMGTERVDLQALVAEGQAAGDRGEIPIRVGHVHLRAADLAASAGFYRDTLGMAVTHERPGALWFGAGDYHHHIATNTWSSDGTARRTDGLLGLVSYELVARDAETFARIAVRIGQAGRPLEDGFEFSDPGGVLIVLKPPRA